MDDGQCEGVALTQRDTVSLADPLRLLLNEGEGVPLCVPLPLPETQPLVLPVRVVDSLGEALVEEAGDNEPLEEANAD